MTVSAGLSTTLVASSRPPSPTSSSSHVRRRAGEAQHRGAGGDLEEGDRAPALRASQLLQQRRQRRLRDQRAGQPDALMKPREMGRGVGVDTLARPLQPRADHRDGRALAVGAGDMDHRRQARSGWPSASSMRQTRSSVRSIIFGCSESSRARIASLVHRRRMAAASGIAMASPRHAPSACGAGRSPWMRGGSRSRSRSRWARWSRSLARGAPPRSSMPWSSRYSARWKPSGSVSRMVCSITRGPGEADQRAGLGDLDVAQHGVGGGDAAGGRVGQHRDEGQPRLAHHLRGDGGARHLHQRQDALLHPRAAGGGEQDERRVDAGGGLGGSAMRLADGMPIEPAMNSKFWQAATVCRPPISPRPTSIASSSPVLARASRMRSG
jgi:hypothetical protein